MDVFVVIAHYNEDLEWTTQLQYPYQVISKAGIPQETPPNRGQEASAYLQYIITNYDNLLEYTIFIHAHRTSWHHLSKIDEKINKIEFKHPYYNINDMITNAVDHTVNEVGLHSLVNPQFPESFNKMPTMFPALERILSMPIDIHALRYKRAGQFYVHRDIILSNSKEIYIQLYEYLMTSDEPSYWTSRMFEYTWHFIFTHNLVDIA